MLHLTLILMSDEILTERFTERITETKSWKKPYGVSIEIKTSESNVSISFHVKQVLDRQQARGLIDLVDNFFTHDVDKIVRIRGGVKITFKSIHFEQMMSLDYSPPHEQEFRKSFELMNKIKDYLAAIKE